MNDLRVPPGQQAYPVRTQNNPAGQGDQTAVNPGAVPEPSGVATAPKDQNMTAARQKASFNPNDGVVFIGLNPSAEAESAALKKATGGKLTEIKDSDGVVDGHDLKTDAGIEAFAKSLGLSEQASGELATLLKSLGLQMRDEMGQLAKLWAKGEQGGSIPSRLVLSGHSSGRSLFGENNRGTLGFEDLATLARIMPKAAAQIEDIHISGCNTGFRVNAEVFKQNFPGLKTFWAYTHTAPSAGTGSTAHLRRWEQLTRGRTDKLDREAFANDLGLRGGNIAVWSAKGGYQSDEAKGKQELSDEELVQVTERYLNGEMENDANGGAFLQEVYNQLQSKAGNAATPEDRKRYEQMIDRTLKLRYYEHVAQNFSQTFGPEVKAAYAELGLEAPDFSRLSRRQAVEAIERFEQAYGEKFRPKFPHANDASEPAVAAPSPTVERGRALLAAMRDLSPVLMDHEWIEPFTPAQSAKEHEDNQNLSYEQVKREAFRGGGGIQIPPEVLERLREMLNEQAAQRRAQQVPASASPTADPVQQPVTRGAGVEPTPQQRAAAMESLRRQLANMPVNRLNLATDQPLPNPRVGLPGGAGR